eukprot:jgi/Hompol1/2514/HPOL_000069-RA
MTFAVLELCRNPHMAKRLADEVIEARATLKSELNADNVNSLRFMDAFVKETQRMNPIFGVLFRQCVRTTEINGYRFLANDLEPVSTITTGLKNGLLVRMTPK